MVKLGSGAIAINEFVVSGPSTWRRRALVGSASRAASETCSFASPFLTRIYASHRCTDVGS